MRVWLLQRTTRCNPEEMTDVVVRAPTERAARALADAVAGDEGLDIWTSRYDASCVPAGEGDAEVIVRSMHED